MPSKLSTSFEPRSDCMEVAEVLRNVLICPLLHSNMQFRERKKKSECIFAVKAQCPRRLTADLLKSSTNEKQEQ